jgi:hypothetical protein
MQTFNTDDNNRAEFFLERETFQTKVAAKTHIVCSVNFSEILALVR